MVFFKWGGLLDDLSNFRGLNDICLIFYIAIYIKYEKDDNYNHIMMMFLCDNISILFPNKLFDI